jgi:hypothetical protein
MLLYTPSYCTRTGQSYLFRKFCPALRPLASPQSNGLSILLKLGDKLISLLHHIIVLLVLVIWSVGFDNPLTSYSVDGAWDSFGGNELCQVTTFD